MSLIEEPLQVCAYGCIFGYHGYAVVAGIDEYRLVV